MTLRWEKNIAWSDIRGHIIGARPLKFIHISKCAGTSIVSSALENGVYWGRHDKEYGLGLEATPEWWHVPFRDINKEIIVKYNWFVVVRNPYTRILSEYYCDRCGIGLNININHTNDAFNAFLIDKIKNRGNSDQHYIEQYRYLRHYAKIHILKMENLNQEFVNLMDRYLLFKIKLKKENVHIYNENDFTISDYSTDLIELINDVYDKDFKIFNYKKIAHGWEFREKDYI
jgi:hypothetical protein